MFLGKRVLITGGTGFVGKCLQDEFAVSAPGCDLVIASRAPADTTFGSHVIWDLTNGDLPTFETDIIIHAATPASAELNAQQPSQMFWANVASMENVIRYAESLSKPPIVLFTSSGGVYGEIPTGRMRFNEADLTAPSPLEVRSAYAQGKRSAEFLLSEASARGVCVGIIARLFAFSGVGLPLDRHFAIGNFVRDAVTRSEITITGNGTAVRSYLDGRDMAEWLLRCCEVGEPGFPYHIGSDQPISILELAELVATRAAGTLDREVSVRVLGESRYTDGVSRYVPETTETRRRLNVEQRISLEESIDAMLLDAERVGSESK